MKPMYGSKQMRATFIYENANYKISYRLFTLSIRPCLSPTCSYYKFGNTVMRNRVRRGCYVSLLGN